MTALLTLRQAADRCGLAVSTLSNQIRSGRIEAVKIGPAYVVTPAALKAYLADRQPSGRPAQRRKARRKRR